MTNLVFPEKKYEIKLFVENGTRLDRVLCDFMNWRHVCDIITVEIDE